MLLDKIITEETAEKHFIEMALTKKFFKLA